MIRRPLRTTSTDTLFPYTTLFRSQTAEGIILHYIGIERRVRRHFAFIFKAHPALVEQFDGITYIVEPFAFGISKGGMGKESHTRLMPHAASYGRSTFGNVSELFRSGALIHRGVRSEARRVGNACVSTGRSRWCAFH